MTIDEKMFEAARKGKTVKVVCTDGEEYTGKASGYSSGANEDDGYATFCVMGDSPICLGANEIKDIEEA